MVLGELVGLGEAAVGVLRHALGHGERPLDQLLEGVGGGVGRGHDGLAAADQDPEAEVLAFLALQALELAQALGVGERDRADQDGVGGVGAPGAGLGDQIGEQVEGGVGVVHEGSFAWRFGTAYIAARARGRKAPDGHNPRGHEPRDP